MAPAMLYLIISINKVRDIKMSKKKLYLMLLLASVGLILFWAGCESSIQESPTASLELESKGSLEFTFNKVSLASDAGAIDTVTVILTRSGYESITKNLAVGSTTASGTIYNVPEGGWELTVKAKDSTGEVLYSGVKQIEIVADETTSVTIELSDTSTSGNLSISVTWEQGDGINWTEYSGNPVLDIGSSGEWDDSLIAHAAVIYNGEKYEMWYSGSDGNHFRIGYAYSTDGINWTKYAGNPVLDIGDAGSWSNYDLFAPDVLFDGSIYRMWFSASETSSKGRIGYAVSVDGITWDIFSDPVIETGSDGEWDEFFAHAPSVTYNGTSYEMWYQGYDSTRYRIGYATSTDGVNWTKYSRNPVLDVGSTGEWDNKYIIAPNVIFDGNEYKMWYSGYATGTYWQTGYATSTNGKDWNKYNGNPVLNSNQTGSWNTISVLGATVLYNGISFKMWFTGNDGTNQRIGYATSP